MKVSIIIVTFNSWPEVQNCLKSIFEHTSNLEIEVVMVDNASNDRTAAKVKTQFPQIKLIENLKNLGFAAANNLGVKNSSGGFLLFLNPDVELFKDALNQLLQASKNDTSAGIISGLLIDQGGKIQTTYIRNFPTPLKTILFDTKLKVIAELMPGLKRWYYPKINMGLKKQKVDQPAGACMMIRRETFKKIGGFDEQFFLFFEDVDLAYRLKQAGYKNYVLPKVKLKHLGGMSIAKERKSKIRSQFLKSAKQYFKKQKKLRK
ncbi:MAG: hypothetical protein COT81_03780 [Candidatus Buchananbacteria bacterium CG10_big_fil_rev_8_21_14_0_10_42_9]|uniref:Glycosyltransferase 2-like domain-containing protein n=1 Tax=Candidatus Buchananbacteria bacterium CG10_big_fil_rev_8_21_14_0_10_42_9 TaxID=1974526 RepID=A0A2H0W0W6_9BACT|nr:MAG: hypothetical protein COT81_03780 [Candidatus Buchananbacteria bacterium CG10_big_fil_rev_8_21_14_0_10_42_9]